MNEAHLIARVLAGDRAAGRELYDAHAPRIFRLAYRMTRDEDLAQECTQDTFVRAFGQLGGFRGEAALGTWIHRIALFVILRTIRGRKRQDSRYTDLAEAEAHRSIEPTADLDLKAGIEKALEALPEIYRTTLILHGLEGYTHSAIAELLGIPEGTSKTRLAFARAEMRGALVMYRCE